MRKLQVTLQLLVAVLLVFGLLVAPISSLIVNAQEGGEPPTVESNEGAAEEVVPEATEEATTEATEEVTTEATEEATTEATEEATTEATEEATTEATEEATTEATEEATTEATEEATPTPTEEVTPEATPTLAATVTVTPTVELTDTLTISPTIAVEAAGEIETQAVSYSGSWTSYVSVQNMGDAAVSDVTVSWYKEGAATVCTSSFLPAENTTLSPGESHVFTPPDTCGDASSFTTGSAVVASGDSLAAVVTTRGSVAGLMADYIGSASPQVGPWYLIGVSNSIYDSLVGITNGGSNEASVRVSLVHFDGSTKATTDINIPSQSAAHVRPNQLFPYDANDPDTLWAGTVKVENISSSNEPLYVVMKAERQQGGMTYPVTLAAEGFTDADAKSTLLVPSLVKRLKKPGYSIGQNVTINVFNPSTTDTVDFTLRIFDGATGSEFNPIDVTLGPLGTSFVNTRDHMGDVPNIWYGSARIEVDGGDTVLAQTEFWVGLNDTPSNYYRGWAVSQPVDPVAGTGTVYFPTVRRQANASGVRVGDGWVTSFSVSNLSSSQTTTVRGELFDSSGTVIFSEDKVVPANGIVGWYTLEAAYHSSLGSDFKGGAKVFVVDGPGPIVGFAQDSLAVYPNSDGYAAYNGVNK